MASDPSAIEGARQAGQALLATAKGVRYRAWQRRRPVRSTREHDGIYPDALNAVAAEIIAAAAPLVCPGCAREASTRASAVTGEPVHIDSTEGRSYICLTAIALRDERLPADRQWKGFARG